MVSVRRNFVMAFHQSREEKTAFRRKKGQQQEAASPNCLAMEEASPPHFLSTQRHLLSSWTGSATETLPVLLELEQCLARAAVIELQH